jgi:DNA-binding CsgD family transcriptional regulator
MNLDTNTASALLWALRLAGEHDGAAVALAAVGIELPEAERFEGVAGELSNLLGRAVADANVREALALGVLAGRVAHHRPRTRRLQDPTSFLMDRELVVQAAKGQSVMRLPWFEEGLFVGRPLPGISEMPSPVRRVCIENYSAALAGERCRFAFNSYGHAYSVDAVPVRRDDGHIEGVLAIATPERCFSSAAAAYERTAERLERSATLAEQAAERHRVAGRRDAELVERRRARKARHGEERARANARALRARGTPAYADPPSVTSREAEVLSLASHGLTSAEIAEQLLVTAATVKTHFENIYAKLGVSDRAAAVGTALRHGLIE